MNRIEINVQTGLQTTVDLTAQEVADAQASKAAWDAEQAAIVAKPSLEEMVAILQAEVAALKGAVT